VFFVYIFPIQTFYGYTDDTMLLNNRYVQLTLLWLGIATVIYIVLFLIFMSLNIDFPVELQVLLSALSSGYLVYKYFSQRIG